MSFLKKAFSLFFRQNVQESHTNDSVGMNGQHTDVKKIEQIIENAQKSGKKQHIKLDISLAPDEYDYLAKKYWNLKLYLMLFIELKIETAPTYKAYVETLQLLRQQWNVTDVIEEEVLFHKIKVTVNECSYDSELSQLLKPLSKKIRIIYRQRDYSFSEFKNAVYKYKEHSIPRLDDYLAQADTIPVTPRIANPPIAESINKSTLNFTAIDFETANSKRSSACSIGLVIVENGTVVNRLHYYINPGHVEWGHINIAKHKITPDMVADADTFDTLWPKISYLISDRTVIAHNASSFDISVLRNCLEMYDIPMPKFRYGCTMEAAKKNGWSTKLKDLCAAHSIGLNHHDALSDAEACATLAIKLHNENLFHTLNFTTFY